MKSLFKSITNVLDLNEDFEGTFRIVFSSNFGASSFIHLNSIRLFDSRGNKLFLDPKTIKNEKGRNNYNESPLNLGEESTSKWADQNFRTFWTSEVTFRILAPNFKWNDSEGLWYELCTASDTPEADPTAWRLEMKRSGSWILLDERKYVTPPKSRNCPYERFPINFHYRPTEKIKASPLRFDPRVDPSVIRRRSSVEIFEGWEKQIESFGVLREYQEARDLIGIHWDFMRTSKMKTCIQRARQKMKESPLKDSFEDTLKSSILKAYPDCDAENVKDSLDASRHLYRDTVSMFNRLEQWRKDLMQLALRELTEAGDTVGLIGILSLLARAGVTCQARQIQAFHSLLLRFYSFETTSKSLSVDLESLSVMEKIVMQRQKVREFVEEWIEARKVRAFKRAFLEPCMAMMIAGGSEDEDVEVHGVNVFSALLYSTLGIQTAVVPYLHDHIKGICTFLVPKSTREILFEALKPSELFKPFPKALPSLSWNESIDLRPHSFLFGGQSPASIGTSASLLELSTERDRKLWGEHLKIFASFFTREVVLEPLFVSMIGDEGPLNSLQAFFSLMKEEEEGAKEIEDVREWIYDSEGNYEFHPERAHRLMCLLGVM